MFNLSGHYELLFLLCFFTRKNFIKKIQQIYIYIYIYNVVITVVLQMGHTFYCLLDLCCGELSCVLRF